jgi:hypothetical protein
MKQPRKKPFQLPHQQRINFFIIFILFSFYPNFLYSQKVLNLNFVFLSQTLIENGYIHKSGVAVYNNGVKYLKGDSIFFNSEKDSILKICYKRKALFILNNNCIKSTKTKIVISPIEHKKTLLNSLYCKSLSKHNYVITIYFLNSPITNTSIILRKRKLNTICIN